MNDPFYHPAAVVTPTQKPRRAFWKNFGGGSLSISLAVHAILLIAGVIWVFQIIPKAEDKLVKFMPQARGGSTPSQTKVSQKQQQAIQPSTSRIAASGVTSAVVLSEPAELSKTVSLGALGGSSLSAGHSGGGDGLGLGDGLKHGSSLNSGMLDGSGSKNPFGMVGSGKSSLVGTLYDLKQLKNRQPSGMTDFRMREELRNLMSHGFLPQEFEKYYHPARQLSQTKFWIPTMTAEAAPAAFEADKEVAPSMWMVIYRGTVVAPKSGKFRFVGASDDCLVVRFNKRFVFDYGYTITSLAVKPNLNAPKDSDYARNFILKTPMSNPLVLYPYQESHTCTSALGGMAAGQTFEVTEGATYPIEILIAEIPGGYFSTALLIEEIGATYEKSSSGSPILPLFRLDESLPERKTNDDAPPFALSGPVWKFNESNGVLKF